MSYVALKHLHLVAVGIGLFLLLLRGFWMTTGSAMLKQKWMRIVTHINYAVLLVAGLGLSFTLGLKPGDNPWLMTKIIGFIVLVLLGASVIPRMPTTSSKFAAWGIALILFIYIVAVALTKNVAPWMAA